MNRPQQETCFVNPDVHRGALIEGMKRFSHEAMATTFELFIVHEDERYAAQAAGAAFDEVDRLERELSRFLENSDVTRINNLPAHQPLQLGLDTFECLKIAQRIYAETNGAFDITIGTLLKCWRNDPRFRGDKFTPAEAGGSHREPSPKEMVRQAHHPEHRRRINFARMHTGTNLIQLNEAEHTIELSASPMQIDLGGIGKGYAVDRVAELLREWSIDVALISGGYSSVLALDAPQKDFRLPIADCRSKNRKSKIENRQLIRGWPLTMTNPAGDKATTGRPKGEILARPSLRDRALSGSGVQKGGHIIDPRNAEPVEGRRAAWSSAPDATTADALSTAFMIMDLDEIKEYCRRHLETLAMVISCCVPRAAYGSTELAEVCESQNTERRTQNEEILRFGQWESIIE
jgi:thiamine biosynthesis lipoprotein